MTRDVDLDDGGDLELGGGVFLTTGEEALYAAAEKHRNPSFAGDEAREPKRELRPPQGRRGRAGAGAPSSKAPDEAGKRPNSIVDDPVELGRNPPAGSQLAAFV